jgi:DNA-directed RNA polymerase subunit M/transcription elongation factor TFIIS
MTRVRTARWPDPMLPETDERRCPTCQSRELTRMGYLILAGETVTEEFLRCEPCGTPFLFVRKAIL